MFVSNMHARPSPQYVKFWTKIKNDTTFLEFIILFQITSDVSLNSYI